MRTITHSSATTALISSIFLAGTAIADDKCPAATPDRIQIGQPVSFSLMNQGEFVLAKKRQKIAENLMAVSTNGYRLDEAISFTHGKSGVAQAGMTFEYRDTNDRGVCGTTSRDEKSTFYVCLQDRDGDGRFEDVAVADSAWDDEPTRFQIEGGAKLTAMQSYLQTVTGPEELPIGLPLAGFAIHIDKVKKKYIQLSHNAGIGFRTYVKPKKRGKEDPVRVHYTNEIEEIRVPTNDLKPVTLGGVTVHFRKNDKGKIEIRTEGSLSTLSPVVSCDGRKLTIGKANLTRVNGGFQSRTSGGMIQVAITMGY